MVHLRKTFGLVWIVGCDQVDGTLGHACDTPTYISGALIQADTVPCRHRESTNTRSLAHMDASHLCSMGKSKVVMLLSSDLIGLD